MNNISFEIKCSITTNEDVEAIINRCLTGKRFTDETISELHKELKDNFNHDTSIEKFSSETY